MPKASELKKGNVVDINGQPHVVKQVEAKSPSARGASTLYKVRFYNLQTRQKLDESFKGDDWLKDMDCVRRQVQYLYRDGDMFTFMDTEDYSQHTLSTDELEDQTEYLIDGLQGIMALLVEGQIVGVELPAAVDLEITDTAPAIKGASASARTKTAVLSTGLEVQVPEYLATGEVIRVSTVTGKFLSRA